MLRGAGVADTRSVHIGLCSACAANVMLDGSWYMLTPCAMVCAFMPTSHESCGSPLRRLPHCPRASPVIGTSLASGDYRVHMMS